MCSHAEVKLELKDKAFLFVRAYAINEKQDPFIKKEMTRLGSLVRSHGIGNKTNKQINNTRKFADHLYCFA